MQGICKHMELVTSHGTAFDVLGGGGLPTQVTWADKSSVDVQVGLSVLSQGKTGSQPWTFSADWGNPTKHDALFGGLTWNLKTAGL